MARTKRRRHDAQLEPRAARGATPSAAPHRLAAARCARSLGIVLLVVGAVTLIALSCPAAGILNRYVDDFLRPPFGQGAWLLAVLLIVAGVLRRAGAAASDYGWVMISASAASSSSSAAQGLIHLVWGEGDEPAQLEQGGGCARPDRSPALLTDLISAARRVRRPAGHRSWSGILLLFNLTLRDVVSPVTSGGRAIAGRH